MDGLVVAGIAICLALALGLAGFFLVARTRRKGRARGQRDGVTVAELLDAARRNGEPIKLNWSRDDLDARGRVRPSAEQNFPTAIFPKVPNKPTKRNRRHDQY